MISGRKRKGVCKILKRKKQLNLAEESVTVKIIKNSSKRKAIAATNVGLMGWGNGDTVLEWL